MSKYSCVRFVIIIIIPAQYHTCITGHKDRASLCRKIFCVRGWIVKYMYLLVCAINIVNIEGSKISCAHTLNRKLITDLVTYDLHYYMHNNYVTHLSLWKDKPIHKVCLIKRVP